MVSKQRSKELKAPDQFQARAANIMDWALLNKAQLIMFAGLLVLVVLALFGYNYWKHTQKDSRIAQLGTVQMMLDNETKAISEEADALRKTMATPKPIGDKLTAADKQTLEAENKKIEVDNNLVEAKIEKLKPNTSDSREAFVKFAKDNTSNPEGWMAGVTAANLYIDADKTAEAKDILKLVIDNSKSSEFYQTHARFILVGLLEDEQKFDEAIKQIDELEKVVNKDFEPKVLLAKGKVQMLKKASDDAKVTLSKLIKEFGNSPEAKEAKSIKALLN